MSLGKLLATGRSLIGGAPDAGRYDISARNRLPKFGGKNPFARPVRPAPPVSMVATATTSAPKPVLAPVNPGEPAAVVAQHKKTQVIEYKKTQRIPEPANRSTGLVSDHALISSTMRGASGRNRLKAGLQTGARVAMGWMKSFWRVTRARAVAALAVARGFKWGSSLQVCRALASGVWVQIRRTAPLGRAMCGRIQSLFGKLTGLFRKQQEPKSVIPRFGKPAVQTELSLDRVKVVRNSLEDSDLEVVTADTATSTQVAPKTPVASPKRGPVPPALKKMTERLLGMRALD